MRTYLISYDLGIPETSFDYERIINYIKSLGDWAKPLKSQWFVVSSEDIKSIRDGLKSLTDVNDKILVMDVTDDYWATERIGKEVTDWMHKNI